MPFACLRSAKGSLDPVGSYPTAKPATTLSTLSARETMAPEQRARRRSFRAQREVMIIDRYGDFFRFPLRFCVKPAHNALQFREFLHHLRGQVALAKFHRPQHLQGLGRGSSIHCLQVPHKYFRLSTFMRRILSP